MHNSRPEFCEQVQQKRLPVATEGVWIQETESTIFAKTSRSRWGSSATSVSGFVQSASTTWQ